MAATRAAPASAPAIWAAWATDTPPTATPAGRSEAMRPRPSSATTARPSKIRSTAMEERTAPNEVSVSLAAAKTRTSSPARKGSRLLAMKPMATACHSGIPGSGPPSPRRSSNCQRNTRSGKVSVARTAATSSGRVRAARRRAPTSAMSTPRSAQRRSPIESAIPRTAEMARRAPEPAGLTSRLDKRQRYEVQQLLE